MANETRSPASPALDSRGLATRLLCSAVFGLGVGMTTHAVCAMVDSRSVGVDQLHGIQSYPHVYRPVLGLGNLISTPPEAIGWGMALVAATLMMLWTRRR